MYRTFRITFPNHTLLDEDTLHWLERMGGYALTDSQRMGLALARHGDALTNDSYRRFTNVDSRIATRELGDLVHQVSWSRMEHGAGPRIGRCRTSR